MRIKGLVVHYSSNISEGSSVMDVVHSVYQGALVGTVK